ncbi:MAG: DUF3817 domain-containing protein [Fimbriimonadaceae bacterium]|nr:DUF3817 domain-containing protein [Fimbriimonadaceae bacterium]
MDLRQPFDRLRLVGCLESASFVILLTVAMPLKYAAGRPEMVNVVGAIHGGLWIVYLLALLAFWIGTRRRFPVLFWGGVASVLPLGPVVYDGWLKRKLAAGDA